MRRVLSANMARHCAPLSGVSADSTTRRTITRLSGNGCDELTSPSRILSMAGAGAASAAPSPSSHAPVLSAAAQAPPPQHRFQPGPRGGGGG
uniref:Uncharacterized protein n=1 Tax=Sphenodon punctatus TaxID=8508 RepID=A0A8D0GTR0_SPHPU